MKHTLRQIGAETGDHPVMQESAFDGKTVYVLVYLDGRWKVERTRPVSRAV